MPIKPENAKRYPLNWKELRAAVLERAGNCCEKCGVPNYAIGYREKDGKFVMLGRSVDEAGLKIDNAEYDGFKVIKIVLTVAHLEHDELETQDITRLRAWCQFDHLAYDLEHHQRNARATRRNRKACGELFA